MAKMTVKAGEEWALKLGKLGERSGAIAKQAIFPAADLVIERIKANLQALPEDEFRFLRGGDVFTGVPAELKSELYAAFGLTPMQKDRDGVWNTKVGVDGYSQQKTRKYKSGVPLPMLARSIERGTSVRKATPFVKPAVQKSKKEAIAKMQQVIDEETEKIMKGK